MAKMPKKPRATKQSPATPVTTVPVPNQADESDDLAAQTLREVRTSMRGQVRPRTTKRRWKSQPEQTLGSVDRDPTLLGSGLSDMLEARGWEKQTAVAAVTARWPSLVGDDLAEHVTPTEFEETTGTLRLQAESTTWAVQVRMLIPVIQQRLDEEVGPGVVRDIQVTGPSAVRRKMGPLRVPGRGPRDTYG